MQLSSPRAARAPEKDRSTSISPPTFGIQTLLERAQLCLSDEETSHSHAISVELAGNLALQPTGNLFPWCWVHEEVYLSGACPVIPGSLVQPGGQISILF